MLIPHVVNELEGERGVSGQPGSPISSRRLTFTADSERFIHDPT